MGVPLKRVVYCDNISFRYIFSRTHEPIKKSGSRD